MLGLMRLMVSRRLPLRCVAGIICHGLPILPLSLLLQCSISLSAHKFFGLPIQHEILRRPVLEVEAERDVLVMSSFEE